MDNGCPCYVLNEPCVPQCTCVNSLMSGGCRRCAKYGSLEQRQVKAKKLVNAAADKDRQIAVLANLVTTIRVDHRYEQDCIHGRECHWCQDADEALAESKRIQEGE